MKDLWGPEEVAKPPSNVYTALTFVMLGTMPHMGWDRFYPDRPLSGPRVAVGLSNVSLVR